MGADNAPNVAAQNEPTFAQLVSLACHDLRTPLATASGFAHTLGRIGGLDPPADRYVEMIGAASDQMADLLDLLGIAARVEAGRFEPQALPVDSRALADAAAARVSDGRATVDGEGTTVQVDRRWSETSLAALADCIRRHGALESVALNVTGPEVALGPVRDEVAPIVLAEDVRDFGAAVSVRVLAASGASVDLDGERLVVRFPE